MFFSHMGCPNPPSPPPPKVKLSNNSAEQNRNCYRTIRVVSCQSRDPVSHMTPSVTLDGVVMVTVVTLRAGDDGSSLTRCHLAESLRPLLSSQRVGSVRHGERVGAYISLIPPPPVSSETPPPCIYPPPPRSELLTDLLTISFFQQIPRMSEASMVQ